MPSTKRMVTMLLLNANGWNRNGDKGIIPVLNDAQNLLLQTENAQTVKLTDGEFPYLTTQDGVYEYEIDDVWRVSKILIKYSRSGGYAYNGYNWYSGFYNYGYNTDNVRRNNRYEAHGKRFMSVNQITTKDRIPGNSSDGVTKAKVIFSENPGDTSEIFLYEAYEMPTQITSENVPISIPTEELQLRALFPSAQLLIEAYQNGNWDEAFNKILTVYKPMVQRQLNAGEQGVSYNITRREE